MEKLSYLAILVFLLMAGCKDNSTNPQQTIHDVYEKTFSRNDFSITPGSNGMSLDAAINTNKTYDLNNVNITTQCSILLTDGSGRQIIGSLPYDGIQDSVNYSWKYSILTGWIDFICTFDKFPIRLYPTQQDSFYFKVIIDSK